jgi:hypothetical protein
MYEFDSDEERYFSWYLNELKEHGVIQGWSYHPKPFTLSDRIVHVFEKKLKTKSIVADSVILNDHKYQADFLVYWSTVWHCKVYMSLVDKYYHKAAAFVANSDKHFSVIDVKGTFAGRHNNSAITFPLDQKWVYQKYGIYVQKIVPIHLFKQTFTPKRYLVTDQSGKPRKLDYKIISVSQYLNSISE